jgi:L-asparaginase
MAKDPTPRVVIVFTGGTISMGFDPKAGGPVPMLSGAEIIARVPGLSDCALIRPASISRGCRGRT